MKTHYIIPIFIPEKACPHRCIYCNQFNITNQTQVTDYNYVTQTIETYLQTIPKEATKRIAFFGGTFTGMSMEEQNLYLERAYPYITRGEIDEIQLSTRPDYINREILENLKHYGVRTIELGAQSLNNEVLQFSGRGHTVQEVEKSSSLIKKHHFKLGLQMMIGLPLDTKQRAIETAQKIVEFGADCTRIYPTLVIKNTFLEKLYLEGKYQPLSIADAIDQTLAVMDIFEKSHLSILRIGLHPSQSLLEGTELVAGPFHVSFKELVLSEKWRRKLQPYIGNLSHKECVIRVPQSEINAAVGYGGRNKKWLQQYFPTVRFIPTTDEFEVLFS